MSTTKTFEELEQGNRELPSSKTNTIGSDCESKTLEFIEDCLSASANPVCLCSFGKDSLVLLHLILRIKKIPVIYWREPFYQKKFAHSQSIAEKWDLEVYDYPPTFTDYLQLGNYFDVYSYYYINGKDYVNLSTGTRDYKPEDKEFLCAIKDLLGRPKVPAYEFNWDCIFHGHKQCDPLYVTDRIELPRLKIFGKGILAMAIKDWTDNEIWDYIHKYDLPFNKERYRAGNEKFNNDVFPTCHDCLDYRKIGSMVYCPKLKKEVPCIAKTEEQNIQCKNQMLGMLYK